MKTSSTNGLSALAASLYLFFLLLFFDSISDKDNLRIWGPFPCLLRKPKATENEWTIVPVFKLSFLQNTGRKEVKYLLLNQEPVFPTSQLLNEPEAIF